MLPSRVVGGELKADASLMPATNAEPTGPLPVDTEPDGPNTAGAAGTQKDGSATSTGPMKAKPKPASVLTRDMRPIYNIQLHSGVYSDSNPWGMHGQWWANGDGIAGTDWLLGELNRGYALGSRLIHLRPIAGHMRGETNMAHSTWMVESMSVERRRYLSAMLMEWMRNHQDCVIELHINANIAAANTLRMDSHPDFRQPNFALARDRDLMLQTMAPWIAIARASLGRIGFSIDAASGPGRRDVWLAAMNTLEIAGVPCRGEAIPYDTNGPMQPHLDAQEWWCTYSYLRYWEAAMGVAPRSTICKAGHRLTVGLGHGHQRHEAEWVEQFMRNGWRIHPFGPEVQAEAWRVYGVLCAENGVDPDRPGY